jgi:hypothetical protein
MLLSEICGLVSVGRPLWREEGSAVCSVIIQWSESRRTRNHTLLSHLRLPQPGGPGSRIYIPQEQGGPVHWSWVNSGTVKVDITIASLALLLLVDGAKRQTVVKFLYVNAPKLVSTQLHSRLGHYGPGVSAAPNINEYQDSSWGVKPGLHLRLKLSAIFEPLV